MVKNDYIQLHIVKPDAPQVGMLYRQASASGVFRITEVHGNDVIVAENVGDHRRGVITPRKRKRTIWLTWDPVGKQLYSGENGQPKRFVEPIVCIGLITNTGSRRIG
jgi:hypothetical protein